MKAWPTPNCKEWGKDAKPAKATTFELIGKYMASAVPGNRSRQIPKERIEN